MLISAVMFVGCAGKELVMAPGMVIEATNSNGTITIRAEDELKRIYFWDDKSKSVKLVPRWKRWYGSLGAYSPGGGLRVHAVVEEGQQHFCCESEAIEWLDWQNERMQWVCTKDGLVVGFVVSEHPSGNQTAIAVEVWRFYINGKRPENLSGDQSKKIKIFVNGEPSATQVPIGSFVPSKPMKINGRQYAGRAVDLMKEMSISPQDVERVLIESAGKEYRDGKYTVFPGKCKSGYCSVTLDESGRVVRLVQ
jgi:hypothetical protein